MKLLTEATRAFLITLEFCECILFVERMMMNESDSTFKSMRCLWLEDHQYDIRCLVVFENTGLFFISRIFWGQDKVDI